MMTALELLRKNPSMDFEAAFCRSTGVFDEEARATPEKVYMTVEIQELFAYLFDILQDRN